MAQKISVPDIGDFKDVEVIDVLVKAGDKISVDTPLITLETEKATMDVPSTSEGVVKAIAIKKGDRVSKGSVILEVDAADAAAKPAPAASPAAPSKAAEAPKKSEMREAVPSATPASSASAQITVPDIGDFKDVEVIEVLVKPGDSISVDTPLITLETEKATMDVPATSAG